jgi:hypothetical protein
LGLQRLHTALYGVQRLCAHHSVVLDGLVQRSAVLPKLVSEIGHPFFSTGQGKAQSVKRNQVLNRADNVRRSMGFLKESKGPLIDGLLNERELTSSRRENKGRTGIVKSIQSEQGILIA